MCNRQRKLVRMYMRERDIDRKCRRKEQELIAYVNRENGGIFRAMLKIAFLFMAVAIGIAVWMWAAGRQAEMEAQAAVLRAHRITADMQYTLGPGVLPGSSPERPVMVESLPEIPPEDGEPPKAIEIVTMDRIAAEAETIPAERWESLGEFTLTFYCPCRKCSEGWGHQTASGATAVEGVTVAVDPRVIPYGTRLRINGREYIAQDCGGSIKGRKIDIFKESHAECLENGEQKAEVMIKR